MKFYDLLGREISREEHLSYLNNRKEVLQEELEDLDRYTALNAGDFYYKRLAETALNKIIREINIVNNGNG